MPSTPQSIINARRSSQRKAALACGQEEIFNASQLQEIPPWGTTKVFTYPPGSKEPSFFVKYSRSNTKWLLEPEMRNHKFAFDALRARGPQQFPGLLVCVPEIFRVFEYRNFYFLVMEFVPGRTLVEVEKDERNALAAAAAGAGAGDKAESQLVKRLYRCVAEGIRLLSVKAPPGTKPGPVGGGRIRHPFFKDSESRIPYRDMKMLETHLNKVLRMRTRGDPNPPTISLERELEFYYADLYGGNFIFTNVANHTVLYILDFDEAGFLPHSFMSFMLHSDIRPMSTWVAQNIVHHIEHNTRDLRIMETLSYYLYSSASYFGKSYPGGVSVWLGIPGRAQVSPTALSHLPNLITNVESLAKGLPLEGYPETDLDSI